MTIKQRKDDLIKGLYDAVVAMDEDAAAKYSQAVLDDGIDVYDAVTKGLTAAMDKVGELYKNKEYFVPELLLCSDALYAGLAILKPHMKMGTGGIKRQLVLGVVEGDIHDIGKNLVKVMFEAAGWIVHDLGKDVKLHSFAEEQKKTKADVVGISALVTTTMLAIPKAIEMLRAEIPNVAIMVGGAPLTAELATRYGADGYASNAGEAISEANKMLERLKSKQTK